MKAFVLFASILLSASFAYAQEKEILFLTGAGSMEELSEDDVERFNRLQTFPVEINRADRNRLNTCGLFTPYQVAAIKDYIMNNGDILSIAELSLVDGFGREMADAVKPFISLTPFHTPGGKANNDTIISRQELMAKTTLKQTGETVYAGKYSIETNKGINAAIAYRDNISGNLNYEGKGIISRIIAGDYYARFGQGLALWDGFQISMSSVGSLFRRQNGFTPANTFSIGTARRGIAMTSSFNTGRTGEIDVSAFTSLTDNNPGIGAYGVNINSFTKTNQTGITYVDDKGKIMASIDHRTHLKKTDVFGEVAVDMTSGRTMATAGVMYLPEYGKTFCLSLIHSEKDALYLGIRKDGLEAFASGEIRQKDKVQTYKSTISWERYVLSDELWIRIKSSERLKPGDSKMLRSSMTVESTYGSEDRFIKWRGDIVMYQGTSGLTYLEFGQKKKGIFPGIYIRAGVFEIENWDNRIYVYERDAPGAFNIPAYYGRGWFTSIYSNWKYEFHRHRRIDFYMRLSYSGGMRGGNRLEKYDARIQCNLKL